MVIFIVLWPGGDVLDAISCGSGDVDAVDWSSQSLSKWRVAARGAAMIDDVFIVNLVDGVW